MKLCAEAGVLTAHAQSAPASSKPDNKAKIRRWTAAERPRWRRTGVRRQNTGDLLLAGGDNSHYPSSWYNKAKKPVRPPTHTGSHAEAIGCINSALLKSSVTFDRT